MARGGWTRQNRDEGEFQFVYSNTDLENIMKKVLLLTQCHQHLTRMPHGKHNTYKEASVRNTNQDILQGPLNGNHGNFGISYGPSE